MSSRLWDRQPSENPAGDGPGDTNALLDELDAGRVVVMESDLTTVWYWTDEGGRIHRETFAGSPPAVSQDWKIDPLFFSSKAAAAMGVGRRTIRLTDREELETRREYRRIALAFQEWWRMEYHLTERGTIRDE